MTIITLKKRLQILEERKNVKRELPWDCKNLMSRYRDESVRQEIIYKLAKIRGEACEPSEPYTACSKAIGISYQTWCNWVNLGKEGKMPYSQWYIKIQGAEADLMKECLDSVKLSMKLGDVKSAMFLLEKRFSDDGYGKTSQVNVNAQNQNLNLNVNSSVTTEDIDKIRAGILARLAPKSRLIEIQE